MSNVKEYVELRTYLPIKTYLAIPISVKGRTMFSYLKSRYKIVKNQLKLKSGNEIFNVVNVISKFDGKCRR